METMLSTEEVAAAVGVTQQAVAKQARAGKLHGARLEGEGWRAVWRVPARYADPEAYRAAVGRPGRKARA